MCFGSRAAARIPNQRSGRFGAPRPTSVSNCFYGQILKLPIDPVCLKVTERPHGFIAPLIALLGNDMIVIV